MTSSLQGAGELRSAAINLKGKGDGALHADAAHSHAMRILLVEDDPGDAVLVQVALASQPPPRLTHVTCLADAVSPIQRSKGFDVILLDLSLPDSHGDSTVTAIRAAYPTVPIVVLTGLDDVATEDAIVQAGAQDYLVKGTFEDQALRRAIRHAIVRQRLEQRILESESAHRKLVNLAPDAIIVASAQRVVSSANPAAARMFGCDSPAAMIGLHLDGFLPDAPALLDASLTSVEARGDGTAVRNGFFFPVSMAVVTLGDDSSLVLVRDITETVRLTTELRQLARTDPLTGLANRRVFAEVAEVEFLRFKRFATAAALLMIDVDHFKVVNDTHGHELGDTALTSLARILETSARGTDLAARFGGEEFVVLLAGTNALGAAETAERIREAASAIALPSPQGVLTFTVSIGVTEFCADDTGWTIAMRRADQALYDAKSAGRNRVTVIPPLSGKTSLP